MTAVAAIFGAGGAIGAALADALEAEGAMTVLRCARGGPIRFDLEDEASLQAAAARCGEAGDVRLAILAAGVLHDPAFGLAPEKSWRELDAGRLARAFAINAIGPALLLKHLLPRLPREGRSVVAVLSARVGSIGDNRLGGWWGYRASKAALNQIVRTAAVELARRAPEAILVALHPGTVASPLSAPFVRPQAAQTPGEAATRLLSVIAGLRAQDSGGFFDHRGEPIPW